MVEGLHGAPAEGLADGSRDVAFPRSSRSREREPLSETCGNGGGIGASGAMRANIRHKGSGEFLRTRSGYQHIHRHCTLQVPAP